MPSFLSPLSNKRTDYVNGSIDNKNCMLTSIRGNFLTTLRKVFVYLLIKEAVGLVCPFIFPNCASPPFIFFSTVTICQIMM